VLLALHEHIVSRVSVSATNSTASGASAGSVPASGTPAASGGRVSSSTAAGPHPGSRNCLRTRNVVRLHKKSIDANPVQIKLMPEDIQAF
jgi:hypothetical protein